MKLAQLEPSFRDLLAQLVPSFGFEDIEGPVIQAGHARFKVARHRVDIKMKVNQSGFKRMT